MMRTMIGFRKDEENDWVAKRSCGHQQHVRHKPPFFSRPWTQSEEGHLDPTTSGIVAPEVLHHVEPDGPMRFFVEFLRQPEP